MAENQQGSPTSTPAWRNLRSPGTRPVAGKSAPPAAKATPDSSRLQPKPRSDSFRPQHMDIPLPLTPAPAPAPMARAKDFKIHNNRAGKLPTLKLDGLKLPDLAKLAAPLARLKASVESFKLPALSRRTQWMVGGAAALAGASLFAVFVQTVQNGVEGNPATPVTSTTPAPEVTANAPAETPESPPATVKPAAPKLPEIGNLPNVADLSDKDTARIAASTKIPHDVVGQALHIYKYVSPENYQPRPTDKIELVYTKANDILYARITTGDSVKDIYGFEDYGGDFGFYTEKGRRIDRSPLTSPVEGKVLPGYKPRRGVDVSFTPTRDFGVHKHPIFGTWVKHSGVDIPATTGTPIYAISDGVIAEKSRDRGYGNQIAIKHAHGMESFYAHLSRFEKQAVGTRIKQGQIIGYVGSTGWATGPHLHFEIKRNGKKIDPLEVASFSSMTLENQDMPGFRNAVTKIKNYIAGNLEKEPEMARKSTPAAPQMAAADSSTPLAQLIQQSASQQGLHPKLLPRLFFKEAGLNARGQLNTTALSDGGAAGLCQFVDEQFLSTMKRHGPQLGFEKYAAMITPTVNKQNRRTYYQAGSHETQILKLRYQQSVAVPLCAAHVREDLDYIKSVTGGEPTFTDSSIAHYLGRGAAKTFLDAYYNPATRDQPAYKFVTPKNYEGPTNMSVFFEGGDMKKPYTVAEVYNSKRAVMGDDKALSGSSIRVADAAKHTLR